MPFNPNSGASSLPTGIAHFDFHDIHGAPDGPGIYAWYAKLPAGAADWKRILDESTGEDLGESRLRELILLHSRKFDPPAYDVVAKSSFELEWHGKLEPQLAYSIDMVLRLGMETNVEQDVYKVFKRTFKTEKARSLLVELISCATPLFAAPVYIGTSANLRRRLTDHAKAISDFARAIAAEPEKRGVLVDYLKSEAGRSNFAARVTALEFAPEQLEVYTMDLREMVHGSHTTEELSAIAATLEWLLNRWHRPIAGRL